VKHVVFSVDETKSYFKEDVRHLTKPNVPLPFVAPLQLGGMVNLAIDEKRNKAYGDITDLTFATDQFKPDTFGPSADPYVITGNLQTFAIIINSNVVMDFKPQTGEISSINGGFGGIFPEPLHGGGGNVSIGKAGPSRFTDGNSPTFNLTDGLGCGGTIVLEIGWGSSSTVYIEGKVSLEDVDGDGQFERHCLQHEKPPRPIKGPPFPHLKAKRLRKSM
jgi:hypothetical protein